MAERKDEDERIQDKPRANRATGEGIQPGKRRPSAPGPDRDDDEDEEPRRGPRREGRRRENDAVSSIIPYHNGMALAAYYVGVFSLVPIFGLILGPLGIIFGIVGTRRVKANPEIKGTGHAIAGIVLGGITTLGNWGVLIFFFLAAFSRR